MNKLTAILNRPQVAAWAGMLGPALFVGIFMLEGRLRSGYDPLAMYVSALSLGPRGWIQMVNFVVLGTLLFIFARGVRAEFQTGKASKAGHWLLKINALCFFLSGPFVMDPMGTLRSQMSLHGTLHGIFGGIVFSLMPISCFVFLRRFRKDPKWQVLQGWTLAAGILITVAVLSLTVATKSPVAEHSFKAWLGLIQRAAIVPWMIWLFAFALLFYRRSVQGLVWFRPESL